MTKPLPLEPGQVYHIYNRGTNRVNVFVEERNYAHFLKLYGQYVALVADTYDYCLLRNHFHLLARIKDSSGLQGLNVAQAFSNFFNAYAKAINKAYHRTGSRSNTRLAGSGWMTNATLPGWWSTSIATRRSMD